MEMDSTYDTKGSGDNLNQGDTLIEGYFWHDRTRSNYQDYPYYNQKGISFNRLRIRVEFIQGCAANPDHENR